MSPTSDRAKTTAPIPQTSDNFPLIPVAGVAIASLAALCFLFLRKKNR